MVSDDDGINTPPLSILQRAKASVRPKNNNNNNTTLLPLSRFRLSRSDRSIPTLDAHPTRERDHIQSASPSSRFHLHTQKRGEKILKKKKKKRNEITRKERDIIRTITRTWTRASSRRSFWAQKPSSAKRSESKWKTSSFACVFFVTFCCSSKKRRFCAFFVKNDCVFLREKTSFFHLSFFIFLASSSRLFLGDLQDLSLCL